MRIHARASLLGVLPLLIASCTPAPPVVLDAVGPAPGSQPIATGSLRVYTRTLDAGYEGQSYFTGYRIYANHKLIRDIYANGSIDETSHEPRVIELPAGKYLVEAEAEHYSKVQVPVVIRSARLTEVHLQHDSKALHGGDSNMVKLPDGLVVGWQARSD